LRPPESFGLIENRIAIAHHRAAFGTLNEPRIARG
jgi:hypothetical protein